MLTSASRPIVRTGRQPTRPPPPRSLPSNWRKVVAATCPAISKLFALGCANAIRDATTWNTKRRMTNARRLMMTYGIRTVLTLPDVDRAASAGEPHRGAAGADAAAHLLFRHGALD